MWTLKREPKRLGNKKTVEYRLQLHANNGSGFDTWIIQNDVTCERNVCKLIKSGKSNISRKIENIQWLEH